MQAEFSIWSWGGKAFFHSFISNAFATWNINQLQTGAFSSSKYLLSKSVLMDMWQYNVQKNTIHILLTILYFNINLMLEKIIYT